MSYNHDPSKSEIPPVKYPTKSYMPNTFIFLILSTFIYSQNGIFPEQSFSIQESSIFLPINHSIKLSYDHTTLYKDGDAIYNVATGRISRVIPSPDSDELFVISAIFQKGKEPATLNFQAISGMEKTEPSWQIKVPYDIGFPDIVIHDERVFFLWSGSQTYSVFTLNGKMVGQYSLFDESPWNMEKVILGLVHNDQLFFLGMQNAMLNSRRNITLFQLEPSLESNPLATFDLVQPYFASFSPDNILAVVGSGSLNGSVDPVPYLTLYDLNGSENVITTPLEKMPRKIRWIHNQLTLVYKDRVTIYDPTDPENPVSINYGREIHPIDYAEVENSLLILAAKSVLPSPKTIKYGTISLMRLDLPKKTVSTYHVSSGSFNKVKLSHPDHSNAYFIQLDDIVNQYNLEQ